MVILYHIINDYANKIDPNCHLLFGCSELKKHYCSIGQYWGIKSKTFSAKEISNKLFNLTIILKSYST